jgi:beta-mannanase
MTAALYRGRSGRPVALVVVLLAAVVGLVTLAPPTYGVPTTTPTVPVTGTSAGPPARTAPALNPPVVPAAGTAYLGAFVDPTGQGLSAADPLGGTSGLAAELDALPSVEPGLGRPLSIVEVDQTWNAPVDIVQLRRVVATGAIPMITWECGDTDANVSAGADDTLIRGFAHEVGTLGTPVLVRWFPDANGSDPATQACLGTEGAAGYVAAFDHVHQLLANAGATNAATVWSVDTTQGSSPVWVGFYPGAGSTNWIAADDESPLATPADPGGATSAFGPWYSTFSTYGSPLLISDTGATTGYQGQFLNELASDLPAQFPLVKGVVYVDAPNPVAQTQLAFDPNGQAAFRSLSRSPYFQPARATSSTTIQTTSAEVPLGQLVPISDVVSASDLGGSVTYKVNGAVLTGCVNLPVVSSAGCNTSTLPLGANSIVAVYSGDTSFQSSTSAPLAVSVVTTATTTTTVPAGAARAKVAGRSQARVVAPRDSTCTVNSPDVSQGSGRQPSVPGPCQAYLGASVQPTSSTLSEPDDLAALDKGLDRPASIVQLDQAWTAPIDGTQLEQVYATGAIPMVTWSCGDLDSHVVQGSDNTAITAAATAMASTGIPILLQWSPDPGSFSTDTSKCLGNLGAAGYVQAFRDIVRQFRAAGADNVAFVWSVDTNDSPAATWKNFYPGAAFVDWIAADGFDRSSSPPTVGLVENRFAAWYSTFSTFNKPLMISDTGAVTGQSPSVQDTYLDLLGSMLPTSFPLIKAVIYQDGRSPGPTGDPYDFTLDPTGLAAFDALSAAPFFQPARVVTSTSVSSSDDAPPQGKVVTITATVGGSDQGGSVSFLDDGSPIPGCEDVQVLNASSCETSSLAVGTHELAADYLGDAASAPSDSTALAVTVSAAVGEQGRPYIPPVGTAYLGAWVRPLPVTKLTPVNQELSALPSFNDGLSRPLSVVHVYQDWSAPTAPASLQKVLANGATPMVDWRCGPSDATILSGQDDAFITSFATELAQLKAPIFLRWFYEFNFPNSPDYKECIGNLGPAGYAAAFRHIHDLFAAAGASNVSFVWCLSSGGQDRDWIKYYPGPASVDWIAVDGYLRNSTDYKDGQFGQLFDSWYSTFASFGKPLMITETAALSGAQGGYLSDVKQSLDTGYPMIRGVLYFDAPGKGGIFQYPLDSSGYSVFASLADDSRFQPPRQPSATSVTVSSTTATPTEAVRISPIVSSDFGGSVSLFVNGSPIAGCQQMAVATHPECTTVSLPSGNDMLTAVYNGDAEFQKSTSVPTRVHLAPLFGTTASASLLSPLSGVPMLRLLGISATPTAEDAPPWAMVRTTDGTPDGLDLWGLLLGHGGWGWAAILAGVLLMIIAGAYMLVTWVKDKQLKAKLSGTLIGTTGK